MQGHAGRHAEHGLGAEQRLAAHRRRQHLGGQALDVDAVLAEQAGDVADDAGAVVAHQFEVDGLALGAGLRPAGRQQHADALAGQRLQGLLQRRVALAGHGDAQDASELPGHARHAALQPVAALLGDAVRQFFHQPRLVGGNHRQYQMVHAGPLCSCVGNHSDGRAGSASQ